jgi:hypothetical protein
MINENPSGAVMCSNFSGGDPSQDASGMFSASWLTLGQIVDVFLIDHPNNRSKQRVEYSVLIEDFGMAQGICTHCCAMDAFGGINNFGETVYQSTTKSSSGKASLSEPNEYRNGATVLVAYVGAHKEAGVILGGWTHPFIQPTVPTTEVMVFEGSGSSTSRTDILKELPLAKSGSTDADINGGQRILGEFNGLRYNINKDGELTIIFQGTKNEEGKLNAPDLQPTIVKFTKEGEFIILDNLDQEIKISRKDQKIIVSDGQSIPNIIIIDRAKNIISIQSNAKIELDADVAEIGRIGATEHAILGDLFKSLYNKLVSAYNGHTHGGSSQTAGGDPVLGNSDATASIAEQMTQKQLSKNVTISKE